MVLGEGRPKICVPLVSPSFEELDRECAALESQRPDMLEWRVDYLLNKEDFNATADLDKAFRIIRSHFQDTPLLTTLRTKSQGGVHKTPGGDYIRLISLILASRWADIIDRWRAFPRRCGWSHSRAHGPDGSYPTAGIPRRAR